jgi:hypothetical protein
MKLRKTGYLNFSCFRFNSWQHSVPSSLGMNYVNKCFRRPFVSFVFSYLYSSFICSNQPKSVTKQWSFCFYRSGIGVCGDNQTIFYAEVTDNMKIGTGKENN